jgi:hypothetical protein
MRCILSLIYIFNWSPNGRSILLVNDTRERGITFNYCNIWGISLSKAFMIQFSSCIRWFSFLLFIHKLNLGLFLQKRIILSKLSVRRYIRFLWGCSCVIKWSCWDLIIIVSSTYSYAVNLTLNSYISWNRSHTVELWIDLIYFFLKE